MAELGDWCWREARFNGVCPGRWTCLPELLMKILGVALLPKIIPLVSFVLLRILTLGHISDSNIATLKVGEDGTLQNNMEEAGKAYTSPGAQLVK